MINTLTLIDLTQMDYSFYEGGPSKPWTFVITRDCASGIL